MSNQIEAENVLKNFFSKKIADGATLGILHSPPEKSVLRKYHCPPIRTLILLYKSLVQSRMDYGVIAYATASKSVVEKINKVARAILRVILG